MRIEIVTLCILLASAGSASAIDVTNYETPGNLQVTHELDCISVDQITNEYTPPDLMKAFVKCGQSGKYDEALPLFMIAGVYARFDTMRVPDNTAHDAFQVLILENEFDDQKTKMDTVFEKYKAKDSPEFAKLCTDVKRIGPPNYQPDYMIQHGMATFLGGGAAKSADFDAHSAWKKSLNSYLHCSVDDLP